MKAGDLVKLRSFSKAKASRANECAIVLGDFVSINAVTGQKYECIEIMWLKDSVIIPCSPKVLEIIQEIK